MSIATHYLNYNGKRDVVGQMVGPTDTGLFYLAVEQEYDEEFDITRVGFAVAARDER